MLQINIIKFFVIYNLANQVLPIFPGTIRKEYYGQHMDGQLNKYCVMYSLHSNESYLDLLHWVTTLSKTYSNRSFSIVYQYVLSFLPTSYSLTSLSFRLKNSVQPFIQSRSSGAVLSQLSCVEVKICGSWRVYGGQPQKNPEQYI